MLTIDDDPAGHARFLAELNRDLEREAIRLSAASCTLDLFFLVYLRRLGRFGFFTLGPVTIDIHLIESVVERETPRGVSGRPAWSDDLVRFSQTLMEVVRSSGRRRIDELHFLFAFMATREGLPGRVFGELGVGPADVEAYLRSGMQPATALEKLYSPEEAAEYLGVHVQTVRGWIRSGRLAARRLAGQRALRITATDLESVLEPVDPGDAG